ncbi:MAG: hypothetical protein HYY51_02490 [Candidatus Magasanikbacteria bacterium]|nr:hypothetical protein [Candidatus Magasanikbacteria bacterium]
MKNTHFTRKKILPRGLEYKNYSLLRILNALSAVIIVLVFCFTLWFVYTYIYKTITQAQYILIQETEPGVKPINFKLYEKVNSAWEQKTTPETAGKNHDPFNETLSTSTYPL